MRNVGGNERALPGGEREGNASYGEVDRAAQDDGGLFFRVAMNGKDRTGLIDVANQSLVGAVHRLPGNAGERLFPRHLAPVDRRWAGYAFAGQNTNQPQKRASANRKKKTLETPPPKTR